MNNSFRVLKQELFADSNMPGAVAYEQSEGLCLDISSIDYTDFKQDEMLNAFLAECDKGNFEEDIVIFKLEYMIAVHCFLMDGRYYPAVRLISTPPINVTGIMHSIGESSEDKGFHFNDIVNQVYEDIAYQHNKERYDKLVNNLNSVNGNRRIAKLDVASAPYRAFLYTFKKADSL